MVKLRLDLSYGVLELVDWMFFYDIVRGYDVEVRGVLRLICRSRF